MSKKNEEFEKLYERGKKLFEKLNNPSLFEVPLKDSVIIANLGKDKDITNLKSLDSLDRENLLDYSIKSNGNLDNSKLKDSISNTYIESSENINNSRREGLLNSEGKFIKVDISQYKSLILKYGKITFNSTYMNNSFVNNNDILYLESKIPIFKAKNSNEIIYDTLKNYHQQGSDKEDRNNVVNINQSNTHKINLDESNFAAIAASQIFIFLHKIIQENFRKRLNKPKNISSAQSTEVIQNQDIIIGYSSLDMNKVFLSEDFKFSNKIKVVEKKKFVQNKKSNEKNKNDKNRSDKNRKGLSKDKEIKDKNEALYDEKGERVIGSLDITCMLKRPYQKLLKEDNKLMTSINNNSNNQNNNINSNINNIYSNNQIFSNDLNNNIKKSSPMKEFIIGEPPLNKNKNNNIFNDLNNSNYGDEDIKKNEEGIQKIQTDIDGDILILYLKINELKASNDTAGSLNSISNINNINEQLNNNINTNKNIIFYNYNGPQPAKRNYYLRHKIFPDNKDAYSEIVWNKVSPDFNYSIQMPFTLNQKTAELLDNGKFLIEIWTKGENKNECLGIITFDLRNVLESLKVDDNTITTLQLYKNKFPYIIYDDYYQVDSIAEAPDLGTLYLKTLLGIGTPSQVNNYIKNMQQINANQYNGLYNSSNMNNFRNENKNKEENKNNKNEEKNEGKNDISLDPFREDNKDIKKEDINNISRAADINVDGILDKNRQNIDNNNIFISKESSINQKDLKKSESFDEQPNKKKIVNPFLVPQNYELEKEAKNSKKETGAFNSNFNLMNSDENLQNIKNNMFESKRYNQGINENINNNINSNAGYRMNKEEKNITNTEKKTIEYNINITHKNINENYNKTGKSNNFNDTSNQPNLNTFNNNTNDNNFNNNSNNNVFNNGNNLFQDINIKNKLNNYIEDELNNKNNNINQNEDKEKNKMENIDYFNNDDNNDFNKGNIKDTFKDESKDIFKDDFKDNSKDNFNLDINKNNKNDFEYQNEKEKEDNLYNNNFNLNNNINNKNQINIINNKPQKELYLDEQHNNNIEILNSNNNRENISHVKKHIFTISIDKIFNCQILSKLPPTYLRYQFFTDQKPLRSELFNYSQFSIDSSVIDVDMKSIHSIILPKVEKIKDYLNDFLVEFLYDNNNKLNKNNNIIIGRVNIPSDEFASLISEKESNNKKGINEISRVLFIYGTEKIQRNKCIIGKLKLSFKYACVDVPISQNNIFNGSLSISNNGLINSLNNNLGPNFAGSIYLEKETIFNRKIPKNACLKINVENFNSSSLFEDYYRKQFSISFVFSAFGEVSKMENQYGKRSTSKKHNLLNCEFNEILSYKLEIDQDIIDYLKCRSGIVYLMYKISSDKKSYMEEDINSDDEKEQNEINNINLMDLGNNKRIIGKGLFTLNEILTSADTNYQEISISQIGNGSMSLGTLNIALTLENDNNNMNIINEEGDNLKQNKSSPFNKFKQGLSNTTSDLYKNHNKTFNKCEPSFYLNGKFLFSIDFRKFYYEINSEIGAIINNSNSFYFVFKLGNKIKKISPKFNKENNELYSLNLSCNLLLLNYVEMIELDLNFNKKLPNDIYNLFNEGIFEIKLYQSENANSLGSFYIDLHKLITSEFYSDNLLFSENNVINLINVKNNSYKNCKIELNVGIFKLNEIQLNNDIMNKMNYLSKNLLNAKKSENNEISNNNIVDISLSNLDYCEYYQYLFVKDFSEYLIRGIFTDEIIVNKNKSKEKDENLTTSEQNNETINTFNLEKIKKLFIFNSVDMFNFINNNIINLVDNKGEVNIINFKKVFKLITKLNFDIFDYYYTNSLKNESTQNNNFDTNTFDYYLNSKIINLDNEDLNVLYYLKDKQNKVDIGVNNNSALNDKNNKTIKKLLTTNYDYGFNETNDYFDVVSLCLFIFDYYYNLNDGTLQNYLKIKNDNKFSKTQPYIYKKSPQYFNQTVNNINIPNLNLNNNMNNIGISADKAKLNNLSKFKTESKIMLVSVLSGHNIVKPNSDFTSRPNCYFVLEFDDKNYTSDVVMNSSQPNFNEELEIKINSEEYILKLNTLLIYITVFSFVDENGSIFIGRCEIAPSKMFPFLNENNECEDFFHIIGEEGQVMGQLNIKFKFDPEVLVNLTRKKILGNNSSFLMSNLNMTDENNLLNTKKNNNTISFSLNNVVENTNKNKFVMTGGFNDNDPLHKKLAEAMNSIDDLTQILQKKVENEKKENEINKFNINNNNINLNLNNNINNKNINNNKINNQNENLSDIKSEGNANTNSNVVLNQNNFEENKDMNDNNFENNNNYNNGNEEEEMYNYNGEEEEVNNEMEEYEEDIGNNQFEEDNLMQNENEHEHENNINNNMNNNDINNEINNIDDINNNNINNNINNNYMNNINNLKNLNNFNNNDNLNDNEYIDNKLTMTDYNNNLNNSQKLSINDEENGKASFYSENKGNNDKNSKMKYMKNYDKKLLNKIQKIMKNQK